MRKLTDDELQFIIGRVMTYAQEAVKEAREQPYSDFKDGRALAFYEALDTIQNELQARDCDLKFFGLDCPLERVLSPRKEHSMKE